MIINNVETLPGETNRITVNIAKLPSHSPIDISITISRAKKEGPILLLSGGLHGDEINGVETVRRIIDQGLNIPEAGTVICIPIINIYGFIHFSRSLPDGKDMNRSFPGNKNGSLAARVAHYLMHDIIPMIDYGVDFHTGVADRTNYPQIRCLTKDPVNDGLAKAFHAPFTLNSPYRPNSFRQASAKLGKKILVFEGGEAGRFDEYAIQEGINGTLRLMNHLGMASRTLIPPTHENKFISNSSWVRAKTSGLFQTLVQSGEYVKKNQLVGHITDPFGEFSVMLKAPSDGYVIGLQNDPILHMGDAVMHIGRTKDS